MIMMMMKLNLISEEKNMILKYKYKINIFGYDK